MNSHHIYPYFTTKREELQKRLADHGVQTLCHYPIPLHKQTCFSGLFDGLDFPEAERIANEEISLPISPVMTEEDAQYVCNVIHGETPETNRTIPFLDLATINNRHTTLLKDATDKVIKKGWYIQGEECTVFEKEFANYVADKSGMMSLHCVGCGNGLDALTLTLIALKQQNGWTSENEVIVPAMTFVATGQAVVRAGLTLRLCDVNEEGLMDPMSAATAITDRTVALLPVHLYGKKADLQTLSELAAIHNLTLIQDAAQAHGISLEVPEGEIIAAFSFYPGKNLGALGDGGAVVTSNEQLSHRVRSLANYGSTTKYHHEIPEAINSRLDEIQAALLRVKLKYLDEDNTHRAKIAEYYDKHL